MKNQKGLRLRYVHNAVRLAMPYSLRAMKIFIKNPASTLRFKGSVSEKFYRVIRKQYPSNFKRSVNVCGFELFLDREDEWFSPVLVSLKCWEPAVTALFYTLLKPGDVVVDVGAFLGYFTLLAAKLVGEKGKVLSFEPNPSTFRLLEAAIDSNRFHNVELYNVAVGDSDDSGYLYLKDPLHTTLRAERLLGARTDTATVRVVTLVNVIPMNKRIVLLKIDAEGSKPYVVEGACQLIKRGLINHIVIEWEGAHWRYHQKLLELLASIYDAYQLTDFHLLFPRISYPSRVKLSPEIDGMLWLCKKFPIN